APLDARAPRRELVEDDPRHRRLGGCAQARQLSSCPVPPHQGPPGRQEGHPGGRGRRCSPPATTCSVTGGPIATSAASTLTGATRRKPSIALSRDSLSSVVRSKCSPMRREGDSYRRRVAEAKRKPPRPAAEG